MLFECVGPAEADVGFYGTDHGHGKYDSVLAETSRFVREVFESVVFKATICRSTRAHAKNCWDISVNRRTMKYRTICAAICRRTMCTFLARKERRMARRIKLISIWPKSQVNRCPSDKFYSVPFHAILIGNFPNPFICHRAREVQINEIPICLISLNVFFFIFFLWQTSSCPGYYRNTHAITSKTVMGSWAYRWYCCCHCRFDYVNIERFK